MSHIPRLTLIGLNNYDESLFDKLVLPEGIDKDLFVNNLLLDYGECPILYTSFDMMKSAIGLWSNKWKDSFEKINEALTSEYNPLHNFDRYEETEDNSTNDLTSKSSGSNENTVSAYNVSTYQPDNKNTSADSTTSNNKNNFKHKGHLFGNIGITTSQNMLLSEISLRANNNIYDIMADMFRKELLLYLY